MATWRTFCSHRRSAILQRRWVVRNQNGGIAKTMEVPWDPIILWSFGRASSSSPEAGLIVLTCAPGEHHEIGLLMLAFS
jgi:hypothetical protein